VSKIDRPDWVEVVKAVIAWAVVVAVLAYNMWGGKGK
jgi:hypothetical protein